MRRHPLAAAAVDLDDPRIFTLRTVEDTFRIRDYLEKQRPRRAVVIGGGSWLLLRAGVEPQTITVLGILLLFIGAIGLTAAVELCKKRKS